MHLRVNLRGVVTTVLDYNILIMRLENELAKFFIELIT